MEGERGGCMKVAKFGGSSLADAHQCQKVIDIIKADPKRRVIVVSAPGKRTPGGHKVTDMLYLTHQLASIDMGGNEVFSSIAERYLNIRNGLGLAYPIEDDLDTVKQAIFDGAEADYCASRGEYLCARLLAAALDFEFVDAAEIVRFTEAGDLDLALSQKLAAKRLQEGCYVVPGFYGADAAGKIVTFSRGGSDITGSILAAALKAPVYENWTDVSGFLAADPRIVKDPCPIEVITYEELHELSYMGAQVLHEDAVYPARRAGVPIHIKNTNAPQEEGTRIVPSKDEHRHVVTGISGKNGFMLVHVSKRHAAGDSGFLRRLVSVFEANGCAVEHMPSSIDTVSVIVREDPFRSRQKKILEEISIFCEPDAIQVQEDIALLAVVGEGMAKRAGVAARLFTALGTAGISVRMILQGASELNIILGVRKENFKPAVQALYREFFKEEA